MMTTYSLFFPRLHFKSAGSPQAPKYRRKCQGRNSDKEMENKGAEEGHDALPLHFRAFAFRISEACS